MPLSTFAIARPIQQTAWMLPLTTTNKESESGNSVVRFVARSSRSSLSALISPLSHRQVRRSLLSNVCQCADFYFTLFFLAAQVRSLPSIAQLRYQTVHQLASAWQLAYTVL